MHDCTYAHADAEAGPESIGMLNSHSQQMRQIACGARHSCSISCKGQVFCWGWDLHGQCGQGRSTVTVDQPQLVKALGGLQVRHM